MIASFNETADICCYVEYLLPCCELWLTFKQLVVLVGGEKIVSTARFSCSKVV
jgi:hypothetical protein